MSEYVSINMSMIMYTCIWPHEPMAPWGLGPEQFCVRSKSPRHGLETSHKPQSPFGAIRSGSCVLSRSKTPWS